jgi:hypothetical protein
MKRRIIYDKSSGRFITLYYTCHKGSWISTNPPVKVFHLVFPNLHKPQTMKTAANPTKPCSPFPDNIPATPT